MSAYSVKVHSAELNRMMKTVVQCIDSKSQKLGNIEISHENNLLTIRGTNGSYAAKMSTPVLGGDGQKFCVDGTMFSRVCGMCNGEIEITTDGKNCTVKGAGRTRMPVVNVEIPVADPVEGETIQIQGENFSKCYGSVAYAVSSDTSRLVLTGVLVETCDSGVRMVALDGFQMALNQTECICQGAVSVRQGLRMMLLLC